MLGYAIETRPGRKASPATLALIVASHAALILAVVSSRTQVPDRVREPPIIVDTIDLPKDPPPRPTEPQSPDSTNRTPQPIELDRSAVIIPIPLPSGSADLGLPPIAGDLGPIQNPVADPPKPIVRVGPKPITSKDVLRPPYPEAKRRLEEEAVLRLRLAIDERGRVRSVDPVGTADPMFLASARNHLIRHWRYTPANEGGHAVPASIVITLRFKLDEI
jgi:protein TonB